MSNNLNNDCIELIFNGTMYFASKNNVIFYFLSFGLRLFKFENFSSL